MLRSSIGRTSDFGSEGSRFESGRSRLNIKGYKQMNNGFNVRKEYKHLSVQELKLIQKRDSLPYSVVALNLNGDLNVGMMARTSALLGAQAFYVFGRRKIDRRSLVGTQNYLDIQRIYGLESVNGDEQVSFEMFNGLVDTLKLNPILIEHGGTPLPEVDWDDYESPAFVFGNESDGFPVEFMESKYPKISIPQYGVMTSYNVASAASIVMWDYVSRRHIVKQ